MGLNNHKDCFKFLFSDLFTDPEYRPIQTHLDLMLTNIISLISWSILDDKVIDSTVENTIDILLSTRTAVDTTHMFMVLANTISSLDILEKELSSSEYYESCQNVYRYKQQLIKITENTYDFDRNSFI